MALMGRCKPGVWPPYTARAKNRGCFAIPTRSLYAQMPRPALVSRQQSAWASLASNVLAMCSQAGMRGRCFARCCAHVDDYYGPRLRQRHRSATQTWETRINTT